MAQEKETTRVLEKAQKYTDDKLNEVIKHFDRATEEMNTTVQGLKYHFDQKTEETKLHFNFVAERLEKSIQSVSEQVITNCEKIEELQDDMNDVKSELQNHSRILEDHGQSLEQIQLDIQTIKHKMDQTVDRDEFIALEKRLSFLEIKFAKLSS